MADAIRTASNAVFNTVELLEAILLELDPQTLLLAQRVDRAFQTTIAGSQQLQRQLWFQPDHGLTRHDNNGWSHFNPLTRQLERNLGVYHSLPWGSGEPEASDVRLVFAHAAAVDDSRADASWRRMLFQQPHHPRDGYTLVRLRQAVEPPCCRFEQAPTLGQLRDALAEPGELDSKA